MMQSDGIARSIFYDWQVRYGKVNEHNAWIPRDWWLEELEQRYDAQFREVFDAIRELMEPGEVPDRRRIGF